ncbi:MAG TPA: hypothetical protein VHN78_12100, partial [Chloroflexota bacterium]|nr:hypothetical protein [Chloroflexota bacterium]
MTLTLMVGTSFSLGLILVSAAELELFLQGKPLPSDHNEAWCRLIAAAVDAGKSISRMHVIPHRLSTWQVSATPEFLTVLHP